MVVRELELDGPRAATSIRFVYPRNWTVILFLATLGALHLVMAIIAFSHREWAGFLSLAFGIIFLVASFGAWITRSELTVNAADRRVRVRTGLGRIAYERCMPFYDVRWVRLMMPPANSAASTARIEIVCTYDVIECPPTNIPRQEALCLAMTLGVRLIKVFGDDSANDPQRIDSVTQN
jgi:hypothetical protein